MTAEKIIENNTSSIEYLVVDFSTVEHPMLKGPIGAIVAPVAPTVKIQNEEYHLEEYWQ